MVGTRLLHYQIEHRLGSGGMGTVYRARDTVLDRVVAIKVLEVADGDARRRLLHEARAASALNHPNIVTIHAVEQQDDMAFIVMEHVEGVPLDRLIPPSGFPLAEALRHALGIADALAAAHAHGIVHRDIKPGNVMVGPGGRVKVLDFGIARRTALPSDVTRPPTLDGTFSGVVAGTPGYMAPEQVSGQSAGPPSDVFALGALLFHLLTGRGPFAAPSTWAVLDATVRSEPPPLTALKPGTPSAVTALVARALAKDPAARYPSGRELHAALADALAAVDGAGARRPSQARRAALVAAALVLAAAAGGLWWMRSRDARLRWVHEEAIPEISRLASTGDAMATFRLGQRALAIAPDDARLLAAWDGATNEVPISSEPDGAELAVQSLTGGDGEWSVIGTTPLTAVLPFGQIRYRLSKPGYETREFVPNPFPETLTLVRTGEGPPGMVHVPAGDVERADERAASVPDFWIDATEVTNRQFKAFVDAGGYTRRELWTVPFVDGGRTLSWDEAMTRFRDATGRPGPSTWELGTFPDGAADHPVSGVSWYEAAAYATHAGRALPTIYHWRRAAGVSGIFSDVLQLGNFGGRGPQAVGVSRCLSPFGAADMMGNVKEWVWNESRAGVRFVLGGAWFEAMYAASDEDARAPFTRDAGFGFRTMLARAPVDEALQRAVVSLDRDPASMVPVGDEVFAGYKRLYDYDARPLDARVDERDDSHPQWIVERVSMAGAYGDERLPVILLLPRSARPPYQTVVYFPGSDAVRARSSRGAYTQFLHFLPISGRAVAYPIYQQTYERRRQPTGPNFAREISIQRGQDLRRTIDYLVSREDVDRDRLAFYGISLGAQLGPVFLAIEPRLRTGVLMSGGFETWTVPAETDPIHFAPRVRQPVLMVNGREDFDLPYETAQVPMFTALGTAAADKRHAVLEGGHIPPRPQLVFKEILDWLDRYLGPVAR